jgi:hypothetical protein
VERIKNKSKIKQIIRKIFLFDRDSVNKNSRVNEKSSKTKPTFFVFSTPIF